MQHKVNIKWQNLFSGVLLVFLRFFEDFLRNKGSLNNEQCVDSWKNYDGFLYDYCVSVILNEIKESTAKSNFWHRAGGLQRFVVSATEGSLEFVVILAHWCKLFHGRSLKFVFGHAQDLIIGLAKLESFHGQLFWSKVKFRSTQSTTKSGCSEKSKDHDDSFDCHRLIRLFASCWLIVDWNRRFNCWWKERFLTLYILTIFYLIWQWRQR